MTWISRASEKASRTSGLKGPISRAITREILHGLLHTAAIVASLMAGDRTVLERHEVTSVTDVTLPVMETLLHLSKHIGV